MYSSLQEFKTGDWQLKYLLNKQCTSCCAIINTQTLQILCREPHVHFTGTQVELQHFLEKWHGRFFSVPVVKIRDLDDYYFLRSESKYRDSMPTSEIVV